MEKAAKKSKAVIDALEVIRLTAVHSDET